MRVLSALVVLALMTAPARAGWAPGNDQVKAYNSAVAALNDGDPDRAAKLLTKALKADPACGSCTSLLGMAMTRQGRSKEALAMLMPLVLEYPDQTELLETASSAAFAQQQFVDARNLALAAVAVAPTQEGAHRALLQANIRLGNYEDAEKALGNAEASLAAGATACMRGDLAAERRRIEDAVAEVPACRAHNPVAADILESNLQAIAGDHPAVISLGVTEIMDELSLHAQAVEAYNGGDMDRAEKLFTQELKQDDRNAQTWALRGLLRFSDNRLEESLSDLSVALDRPEYVAVHESGSMTGVLTKTSEHQYIDTLEHAAIARVLILVGQEQFKEARARGIEAARKLDRPWVRELSDVCIDTAEQGASGTWDRMLKLAETRAKANATQSVLFFMVQTDPSQVPDSALPLLSDGQREWLIAKRAYTVESARVDAENAVIAAFNDAVRQIQQSDCDGMRKHLDPIRDQLLEPMVEQVMRWDYICAVQDSDTKQAAAMLDEHGIALLTASAVFNHGVLLQQQGDMDGGNALIDQACAVAEGPLAKHCEKGKQ